LDPRIWLLLAVVLLEAIAICFWPASYLLDSSDAPSRVGSMFLSRYLPPNTVLAAIKPIVDELFPGALWTWEHLVAFVIQLYLAAFVVYAAAAWLAHRAGSGLRLRWVILPVVLLQATLVLIPASMTTDVFNYAIYGEMPVLYGANPFVRTPAEFPQSPLYYMIPLYWHDAPSVYGPAWVALSVGVASLLRAQPLADEILAYRLIANVANLLNVWLVWAIARRLRPSVAPSAAIAYGWNPLTLIEFGFNGHNDVVMLTFALAAFWLATYRRFRLAALVLGFSVACKYTSVLLAPVLLVWCARQASEGWLRQLRTLALLGLLTVAPVVLLYIPWWEGPGTFGPVLYWMSGPRLKHFWPEPALQTLAGWITGVGGMSHDDAWELLFGGFKLLAKIGLTLYIAVEALRSRTLEQVLGASARISLVFLLLVNTWLMPWYYTWPLTFAAALGWGATLVRVCAGFTLMVFILMYQDQYGHQVQREWGGVAMVLPALFILVAAAWSRWGSRVTLPMPFRAARMDRKLRGYSAQPLSSQERG
jgi:hypothetical protein